MIPAYSPKEERTTLRIVLLLSRKVITLSDTRVCRWDNLSDTRVYMPVSVTYPGVYAVSVTYPGGMCTTVYVPGGYVHNCVCTRVGRYPSLYTRVGRYPSLYTRVVYVPLIPQGGVCTAHTSGWWEEGGCT